MLLDAEQLALLRALIGEDAPARDAALRRVLAEPVKPWP